MSYQCMFLRALKTVDIDKLMSNSIGKKLGILHLPLDTFWSQVSFFERFFKKVSIAFEKVSTAFGMA